jgi:hypothetical protein
MNFDIKGSNDSWGNRNVIHFGPNRNVIQFPEAPNNDPQIQTPSTMLKKHRYQPTSCRQWTPEVSTINTDFS